MERKYIKRRNYVVHAFLDSYLYMNQCNRGIIAQNLGKKIIAMIPYKNGESFEAIELNVPKERNAARV